MITYLSYLHRGLSTCVRARACAQTIMQAYIWCKCRMHCLDSKIPFFITRECCLLCEINWMGSKYWYLVIWLTVKIVNLEIRWTSDYSKTEDLYNYFDLFVIHVIGVKGSWLKHLLSVCYRLWVHSIYLTTGIDWISFVINGQKSPRVQLLIDSWNPKLVRVYLNCMCRSLG